MPENRKISEIRENLKEYEKSPKKYERMRENLERSEMIQKDPTELKRITGKSIESERIRKGP